MKGLTKTLLTPFTLVLLALGSTANAYVISDTSAGALNGTDVGSLDTFLAEGAKQGNPTSELAWVNAILSPASTTYDGHKTEDVVYFETDAADIYAFQLSSGPGHYVIKNAQRIALFENNSEAGWGVFNVNDLSAAMNLPDLQEMEISHVTEFGYNTPTSVPEPNTIALMSLGILGLVATRRIKNA